MGQCPVRGRMNVVLAGSSTPQRTAANGRSRPFRRIPATVLFLIIQQPLGVDCRNWYSCPRLRRNAVSKWSIARVGLSHPQPEPPAPLPSIGEARVDLQRLVDQGYSGV